jgi:hypothetical protein
MIVQQITIPYLEKILVAEKRAPRYYNVVKKRGTNKIPPSFAKKVGTKYQIDKFGYLIDKDTKEKVISNKKTVGQKRYWVINFQNLYSNTVHHSNRAFFVNEIKKHIRGYIHTINQVYTFPIKIELTIYSKEMKVDVDNKCVLFIKCFQDVLVKDKIIPDDSSEYINNVEYKWIKSDREEMEFKIIEL